MKKKNYPTHQAHEDLMGKSFKAKIIFACMMVCMSFVPLHAQLTVSTLPQNKNFLIERGTGLACCSCPGVTLKCDNVIANQPAGRGFLLEYHFGPDAKPQSGPLNTDYRTVYGDSILSWPFYLNMMVNRRDRGAPYGSTYIFGNTDQVTPEAASVVAQASPVNLAMSSTFNSVTREITVNVKAYYTANSAKPVNFLQIAVSEDSLISPQCDVSGWNYSFVHMNVFRANINGFSGDSITQTTAGTMISKTYHFILPVKFGTGPVSGQTTCNPSHCKLTMYMTETPNASGIQSFTGKILTVIRTRLGDTSTATGIDESASTDNVTLYPNPSTGVVYLNSTITGNYSYDVVDMMGRNVATGNGTGATEKMIDLANLPKGMYNIRVISGSGVSMHKVLLTN